MWQQREPGQRHGKTHHVRCPGTRVAGTPGRCWDVGLLACPGNLPHAQVCLYHPLPKKSVFVLFQQDWPDLLVQYFPLLVTARTDEGAHGVSASVLLTF